VVARGEDTLHGLSGFHRQGALFHDDLGRLGTLQDLAGGFFPVLQVGGHAGAHPEGLGGGVDADEDDVVLPDGRFDVGAEKEVAAAGRLYHLVQAGLEDGHAVGVPLGDAVGVDVHHGDFVLGHFLAIMAMVGPPT
jgi:hypothetical protein